ncbi:ATP-dependent RNA helicase [Podosphaera aphanis]|nr:ATP-dependent RNA helicase [Podosphaera aphanis]
MSLRRKGPARLTLQDPRKVGSSHHGSGSPPPRKQDGPFGGMNQTVANIRGVPERPSGFTTIRKTNEDPRMTGRSKDRFEKKKQTFKALKMQRPLASVSYESRSQIKERIQDITSFDIFPLLKEVSKSIYTQALEGMVDVKPTPVQRIAIPALLQKKKPSQTTKPNHETYLIAAETGSGKTLAYVIPVINAIKLAELDDSEVQEFDKAVREEKARAIFAPSLADKPHPTTARPRAIILVPTQELVAQVGATVKLFSHTVKFRSAMISSALSGTVIRNRLFSPKGIDIVISTPHLLASIVDGDPNILSRVTHIVADEADSLLDRGFAPLTTAIIDRASSSLKQLIMCSATIPRTLDNFLRARYPDTKRLVTPNLHAIPRRVQLGVVDVELSPYQGNKDLACADTIWSIGKAAADHNGPEEGMIDVKRILVFVNKREQTLELRDYLISKGIQAVAMSRDTVDERLSEVLSTFTQSEPLIIPRGEHPGSLSDNQPNYVPLGQEAPPVKKVLPNVKVIVSTDLGSRGVDTLAVRNVILYDVPHSTIDFIHRLGRTGRMGRRGKGYVLVGKDDRRDIVAEVRQGMYLGKSLI